MTEKIQTGAVLVATGTVLPASMNGTAANGTSPYEGAPFMPGWHWLKNLDSTGMNRMVSEAGWNFFYLAGAIEMIAYGADAERAANKALKRIVKSLQTKQFNCLEITSVTANRFLGWPYVLVAAHSRHVQKSQLLFADAPTTATPDKAQAV